jgi:type IV secretion system protein VirB10
MPQIPQGLGEALAKAAQAQGGGEQDGDAIKANFAANSGGNLDSLETERDLGDCELVAGTPISAANIMALNTDVPAKAAIKIAITQTVYCGGQRQHIALPPGSEFTASANARVTYGDNRIQVCADQLRRPPSAGHPNGTLMPIKGCWVAAEIDGTPGWDADVDNHWGQLIAGVALSTVLSLGTSASTGSTEGFAPTIAQGAARQAGSQMNQAGQRIVQRDLMRKPTLTRDMLKHALVIVTTNQPLTPWVAEKVVRLRRW